jgi:hypothetical protein
MGAHAHKERAPENDLVHFARLHVSATVAVPSIAAGGTDFSIKATVRCVQAASERLYLPLGYADCAPG